MNCIDSIILSIIIPVYNKEDYIRECLDSLIEMKKLSYEIIIVDDGSVDNSLNICKEYVDKFSNVRITQQINSGVSVARNTGINEARGKFITFIDADDFVKPDFEKNIFKALKTEADFYQFNYTRWISQEKQEVGDMSLKSGYSIDMSAWTEQISGLEICAICMCGRLYKRAIIEKNKLRFRVGMKTCEDFLFNIQYLSCVSSYYVSEAADYCYRLNPESVTNKRALSHADDYELIYQEAKAYLSTHSGTGEHYCLYQERWIRWCIDLVVNWEKQGISSKTIWSTLSDKAFYNEIIRNDCGITKQAMFERLLIAHQMGKIAKLYMDLINFVKRILGRYSL